jgi:hypothetical protein
MIGIMLLRADVLKHVGQGRRAVLGRGMRHAAAVLWRNRIAMLSTSSTATIPHTELRFFQVTLYKHMGLYNIHTRACKDKH